VGRDESWAVVLLGRCEQSETLYVPLLGCVFVNGYLNPNSQVLAVDLQQSAVLLPIAIFLLPFIRSLCRSNGRNHRIKEW